MNLIEFTKIMKLLSMAYNKDFDEDMIKLWHFNFKDIKKEILTESVKKIIKEKKYMPSIAELLEECEKQKEDIKINILETMRKDNYFANSYEYEKAMKFITRGIIPSWLKEDMKKYQKIQIQSNIKLLEN